MVNEAFSFLPPLSLHLFLSLPSFLSPNLPIFLLSHLPRPVCSIEQPALGHRPRSSGVTCRCVLTTCSQRKGFPGRGNSVGMGQDGSSGTTEGGASVQVGGREGRVEGVWLCCCFPYMHSPCGDGLNWSPGAELVWTKPCSLQCWGLAGRGGHRSASPA